MKRQMQKLIKVLGTICVSSLLATGCSSTPAPDTAAKQTVDLPLSDTADNATLSEPDTAQNDTDADASGTEPAPDDTGTDTTEGKWHVLPPEIASAVDADFEGTVWKFDNDSFYIAEVTIELLDDSLLTGGPSPDAEIPDSELIPVLYDENTHFYIRTIYNGGESYEDTEGTSQDIKQYDDVALKGSFENDVFHATEIRIARVS